ncbi:hypothetical protein AWJ20_774 [Sugiyamaella lignohabitans]|uniref:Zn(2)-C6 fungal-type domain-containing protein n=1 Tax=Sugiyamaella lignohabitans TaxID=796027 RepID=A0A161HKV5_9ASCO|nr:uncharacterized protein AWJ20_774 [Sugiyamaella lignohabitans]ANB12518.1 hypothetical protein AWJ20_774 [Sugiyamaella lignohabitans]
MKKTKCDGKKPCGRCSQDDKICTYSEKKKHQEKLYSSGYVELLETRIDILQECLQRIVFNLANHEDVSHFIPKTRDFSINHLVELFAKDPNSRFSGSQFNPTDVSDDESTSPVKSVVDVEVEEKPKKKRGRRRKVDIEREREEKLKKERELEREELNEEDEDDEDPLKRGLVADPLEDEIESNDRESQPSVQYTENDSDDERDLDDRDDQHSPTSLHNMNLEPQVSALPILSQTMPALDNDSPFSNSDLISTPSGVEPGFDYRFDLGQYRSGGAIMAAAITGEFNPSGSDGSISSVASSPTVESELLPWDTVSPAQLNDTTPSFGGYQTFSRSTDDLLASSPSASIMSSRSGRQGSTSSHHTSNKVHKSGAHHYHHHHHAGTSTPPGVFYTGQSKLRERSRSKTDTKARSSGSVDEDVDRRGTLFSGHARSLTSAATFPIASSSIYSQQIPQIPHLPIQPPVLQQTPITQDMDSGLLLADQQMGTIDDLNLGELLISNEGVFYADDQNGLVK